MNIETNSQEKSFARDLDDEANEKANQDTANLVLGTNDEADDDLEGDQAVVDIADLDLVEDKMCHKNYYTHLKYTHTLIQRW